MSYTIGIICEYNPFHRGHKYQIDEIRKIYPDATVIGIMSGNIVQRGEFAIIDKYERARMALECGINAVFEIPYPYCGATAEIFASAGVEIAHKLGCDLICFGTEKLEIEEIKRIAEVVDSEKFQEEMKEYIKDKSISFISAKEKVLQKLGCAVTRSPNDMLAVEYIRAIKNKGYSMGYMPIQRFGANYTDENICEIMSATAIRKYFYKNKKFISVPNRIANWYEEIVANGNWLDIEISNSFLQSYFLLRGEELYKVFDSNKEISKIVKTSARDSTNESDFINKLSAKIYTTSRIKRVMLYEIFKVYDIDSSPKFTILLGADSKGLSAIKRAKKSFTVITKHSDCKKMSPENCELLERVYLVDQVHNSLLHKKLMPSLAYKRLPIIKKDSTV